MTVARDRGSARLGALAWLDRHRRKPAVPAVLFPADDTRYVTRNAQPP